MHFITPVLRFYDLFSLKKKKEKELTSKGKTMSMKLSKFLDWGEAYLTVMPINVFTPVTSPAPDASFIPTEGSDVIEQVW